MSHRAFASVILGAALWVGCGSNPAMGTNDLSVPLDLSVEADLSVAAPPDLARVGGDDGGPILVGDGGESCGANTNFTLRYEGNRTCNARTTGGMSGASCTTSADCAEVCCDCASSTNKYMASYCADGKCRPELACACTNNPTKLKADNICP